MTRHRSTAVLVTVAVALLAASAPATAASAAGATAASEAGATPVTLTITVTDDFNEPIRDATVTAEWDGGSAEGTTRSNGQVLLDVETGADVTITVQHPGYTRNDPFVLRDAEQESVHVEVYRRARAEVKVTRADGTPLRDARVLLYKGGDFVVQGRTDQDGLFESGVIERGDYHVVAVKEGFYRNETDLEVRDRTEVVLGLSEGTVQLSVTVKDSHFSPARPIETARVDVEGVGTVNTGGSGQQAVVVPVNSDIDVSVTKNGYTSKSRTVSVAEQDTAVEFAITRQDRLNLSASNERVVEGENVRVTVIDEYGEPVEGASVLVDGEQVATTDAEGVARATLESRGTVTIVAEFDGTTSNEVTVEVISPGGNSPTSTATPSPGGSESVPGFGVPAALVALAAAVLLSRRL